jgi:hypothetical protein
MWYICGMNHSDLLLADQWILVREGIEPSLPNCLSVIKTLDMFVFVQYSDLFEYDGNSQSNYLPPVCVHRCWITTARELWDAFIADGWKPVDADNPSGCDSACKAYRAIEYRHTLTNKTSGHFSGLYLGEFPHSDPKSALFFVDDYGGIISVENLRLHPVTGMPRNPAADRQNTRRSYRTVIKNSTITKNYYPNSFDNYALGA